MIGAEQASSAVRATVTSKASVRKLAVLGSPISHSLSPDIHRAAYAQLGLDWTYEAIEVPETQLSGFLSGCGPDWLGFSITMPLKREAFALAHEVDQDASEVRVANTLVRDDGGWRGFNTDVGGVVASLRALEVTPSRGAAVFGAGATATSVAFALERAGYRHITFFARRPEQVEEIAKILPSSVEVSHGVLPNLNSSAETVAEFNAALGGVGLVVSTLPNGATGELVIDDRLPSQIALFDVVYGAAPTPLKKFWKECRGSSIDGRELLVQQALLQIRIFLFGSPETALPDEGAVVEVMRLASVGG